MADLSFSDLRTRGDIWMDDADNFAFTAAAKDEAMKTAINDDNDVVITAVDDSLTTQDGVLRYAIDESYTAVTRVQIETLDGRFIDVAPDHWSVEAGELVFEMPLPAGKSLKLNVIQKLYDFDLIPQLQQSYVLHCFCAALTQQLMSRKTGRFLRNQTTMTELLAKQNLHMTEAARLRKRIHSRPGTRL